MKRPRFSSVLPNHNFAPLAELRPGVEGGRSGLDKLRHFMALFAQ